MRILNDSSTYRLLGSINLRSPFGPRDHAFIRLALHTGLRVGELSGLDVGCVCGSNGPRDWLDLKPETAKGRRSRQIPLSAGAKRAILELVNFLKMRGFSTAPDAPLLQDRRHRRLPPREIQRLVQRYREAAGLDIRVTPHTFRHTYASQLARFTSLRVVQQLLGHVFLSSTQVYLHTQPAELVAAVAGLPDI